MNVPLYDATGLRIYRELMHREQRCSTLWRGNYGPEALQRKPDPELMQNLGKFEKFASVPMPLDVQLRALQAERKEQGKSARTIEENSFPKLAKFPVSQLAVDLWGDAAWHTQEKKAKGEPAPYAPPPPPSYRWSRRAWNVDHARYEREGLGPAHVTARSLAEGKR